MKTIYQSATVLLGLVAPWHIQAQRHRQGGRGTKVVTVVDQGNPVIVTETASIVYVTVTRSPGGQGSSTNDVVVLASSSLVPVESPVISSKTPDTSETPSSTTTPRLRKTSTPTTASSTSSSSSFSSSSFSSPSFSSPSSSSSASETLVSTQGPTATQDNRGNGGNGGSGSLTIAITNSYGTPLSVSLASNVPGPSPDGNPQPTTLASTTSYTFPIGWAGRISIGQGLTSVNSLIEASFHGVGVWRTAVDVSYVDGYSVPITCSAGGHAVTGCNIELFDQEGLECDLPLDHGACPNSASHDDDGPAAPFFAACQGAAYTFPNDNTATDGSVEGLQISCCIGTSCPAPPLQKSYHKRDVTFALPEPSPLGVDQHQHSYRHLSSLRSQVHRLLHEAKFRR